MSEQPKNNERLKCLFRQAKAVQDLDEAITNMDRCIDDLNGKLEGKFSRPTAKIKRSLLDLREEIKK
jgi:hypothetical protein